MKVTRSTQGNTGRLRSLIFLPFPSFPLFPSYPSPFYEQDLNKAVDGAYPMLAKVCKEAAIDCHLADTRDINPPLVRSEGGRGRGGC